MCDASLLDDNLKRDLDGGGRSTVIAFISPHKEYTNFSIGFLCKEFGGNIIERITIDHFWDSIVTIGNLPIRKSGAMTNILRDAMKGMDDHHDEL